LYNIGIKQENKKRGAFGQTVGQVVRHQYRKVYEVDNGNTSLPRKIIKSTFFFVIFGYGLLIVSADWLDHFF
jgi:hypothetical protein